MRLTIVGVRIIDSWPIGVAMRGSFDRRGFLRVSGVAGLATAGVAAGSGMASAGAVPGPADDGVTGGRFAVRHRIVRTNGIDMHVAEAGRGPVVLLLHGFPEFWYSWRHQLPVLAAAGFRAVAPDLRGYGRTDAPKVAGGYSLRDNLADLTGLLDALGVRGAAVVGHDQGATVAWAGAQLYPERFPVVVSLGVPYPGRLPLPITQYMRQTNPGMFNVVVYFQRQGVAEAQLDADVDRTLRMTLFALSGDAPADLVPRWLMRTPEGSGYLDPLPDPGRPSHWSHWLGDAEFGHYVREFGRTGFAGAIRRYRSLDFDWSDLPEIGTLKVGQPALYVTGDRDSAYVFNKDLDPMRAMVPGLRDVVVLRGCGHWTQQERARQVNGRLVRFLRSEYAGGVPHG
ncbi:alpha/beta fold hydrolase [Actinomadura xylanilytica]|uniref:alpha/beta fold hydrolase n=1 Tax=Actinomadura xylanilytica TaxID=887459 RepID=UPI00255B0282|nr:alpha/beta hydrolase [Actinomadura xylanilytica]MDL4776886.1 alpha/beta hydrolase [Actinomadura xylanilytica]